MGVLIHCIYCSRSSRAFSEQEIPSLLDAARRNNARNRITGMLLFVDRSFFQILEGDEGDVDSTFHRIAQDPRHQRVTQIIREPIPHRSFGDWTMGFARTCQVELAELSGENDFFSNPDSLESLTPGRAKKLLGVFKDGGWRADATGIFDASLGKFAQRR
jgi:Sensors of blue-light using FAD